MTTADPSFGSLLKTRPAADLRAHERVQCTILMAIPDRDQHRRQPSEDDPAQSDQTAESDFEESSADFSQPSEESGVNTDMGTLAIEQGGFQPAPLNDSFAAPRTSPGGLSDAEIMLQVREGDDSCFGFLVEKYRKPMLYFMFRMVRNQSIAEELAQEVFLRVYRSRHTYRAEAKFSTWLYRIATNLAVNHARDTKYERSAQTIYLDQPDADTGSTPDVADTTAGAEDRLVRDERMRAIRQHVLALPERQRVAVIMHKYQGMDYKQIGETLKLSESATKSLLFRAYQALREKLKNFVE